MDRYIIELASKIVASHIANHKVEADEIPAFLSQTYHALSALRTPVEAQAVPVFTIVVEDDEPALVEDVEIADEAIAA